MPKISVCIPSWGKEEALERAISSIKNQTYEDYEIVVGEHPVIGIARNYAAREAKGEYLVFIDADVILIHNALKHYEKLLDDNPDCVIVGQYHWLPPTYPVKEVKGIIGNDDRVFDNKPKNKWALDFYSGNYALTRKLHFAVGEYDEKITGHGGEDCEFAIRCQGKGHKAIFTDKVTGFHIYHDRNLEKNEKEVLENVKYIKEKHDLDGLGIVDGNIKKGELPLIWKQK